MLVSLALDLFLEASIRKTLTDSKSLHKPTCFYTDFCIFWVLVRIVWGHGIVDEQFGKIYVLSVSHIDVEMRNFISVNWRYLLVKEPQSCQVHCSGFSDLIGVRCFGYPISILEKMRGIIYIYIYSQIKILVLI